MKRTKFIALSLVVAFALSGIAYAAWTDQTTFNQTVNTGEFDITLETGCNQSLVEGIYYYGSDAKVNGINNYDGGAAVPGLDPVFGASTGNAVVTSSMSAFPTKKGIDVEITNLFPGTYGVSEVMIQNNGTVPAAVESINVTYKNMGIDDLGKELWVEVEVKYNGASLGKVACKLGDLESEMNKFYSSKNLRFDPSFQIVDGEVTNVALADKAITHTIKVGMNEDQHVWENDITENQEYSFAIAYNWRQWNLVK